MLVAQSCPTFCDPMDCRPLGSSVHGIFQARILDLVAIFFSRGSSRPRNRTWISCIAGRFFTFTREAQHRVLLKNKQKRDLRWKYISETEINSENYFTWIDTHFINRKTRREKLYDMFKFLKICEWSGKDNAFLLTSSNI